MIHGDYWHFVMEFYDKTPYDTVITGLIERVGWKVYGVVNVFVIGI